MKVLGDLMCNYISLTLLEVGIECYNAKSAFQKTNKEASADPTVK